ncbi:MAG: preprotein translocase subunit YajC [Planctomycetota bacterium]|jgi:preprotein translocase subunit YajC
MENTATETAPAAQPATGNNAETTEIPRTDAAAGGAAQEGAGSSFWLILVLWIGVIYFFFMRPQKKKEQNRKQLLEQVAKGDKVITVGGIHGEVTNISDDVITLKIDDKTGATIKMSKAAVNSIPKKEEELGITTEEKK